MALEWRENDAVEEALEEAGRTGRPLYADFWAPGCKGCGAMEARTYPNSAVRGLLSDHFVLLRYNVLEAGPELQRLTGSRPLVWTPTLTVLDPGGSEYRRIVGYLPAPRLVAQLRLARGLILLRRKELAAASQVLAEALDAGGDDETAEALYWLGVADFYRKGRDGSALEARWSELLERFPGSRWADRADVLDAAPAEAT